MASINNLSQPQMGEIFRRLKALENAAPMNNGAVGRSGFEVYDGGNINISNGSITINGSLTGGGGFSWTGSFYQSGTTTLSGSTTIAGPTGVTGSLTIAGATSVTGDFTVTGPTKLNGQTDVGGDFTVTGPTKINGTMDISGSTKVTGNLDVSGPMATKGTLSVEGVTTLKNDLNVVSGGKITVGGMTLDPTSGGGSVVFSTGGGVQGSGGNFVAKGAGNSGFLSNTEATVFAGSKQITVSNAGYQFAGVPTTAAAANVYMDASGNLFRKP